MIGCGALAALLCLSFTVIFGFIYKTGKDMTEGVTDPKTREENARKMLGALPPGYTPVASLNVFGMFQTAMLVDGTFLEDGGIDRLDHSFMYFKVGANQNNKRTKAFFTGDGADPAALRTSGIGFSLDPRDVVKRGNLTIDGRKLYYVVARGQLDLNHDGAGVRQELHTLTLFDCPGDDLRVGIWSMQDPAPEKPASTIDVTATVGDEAKMVPFFKPMNPCGG